MQAGFFDLEPVMGTSILTPAANREINTATSVNTSGKVVVAAGYVRCRTDIRRILRQTAIQSGQPIAPGPYPTSESHHCRSRSRLPVFPPPGESGAVN